MVEIARTRCPFCAKFTLYSEPLSNSPLAVRIIKSSNKWVYRCRGCDFVGIGPPGAHYEEIEPAWWINDVESLKSRVRRLCECRLLF